jgi:hypothetical protein
MAGIREDSLRVGVVFFISNFLEFSGASCISPRDILGPRPMPPAASCSWRQEAGRIVGRVPSRGDLPESWPAVDLFPFSSLILYVYCTFCVYYNSHIKRLQHISQNIFDPPTVPLWHAFGRPSPIADDSTNEDAGSHRTATIV